MQNNKLICFVQVKEVDGFEMVRTMAAEVQIMMQHKIDAIKRIMELAENIALDHKYDKVGWGWGQKRTDLNKYIISMVNKFTTSMVAWPTSLEDYFQKGAELLGPKAALNLKYVDTRPNIAKHIFYIFFISLIWQTFKSSGTIFANKAWYRRTKDLVPLLTQKCTFLKIVF